MSSKILIVDDDSDFLTILRRVLTKASYKVVSARSGKECLEKIVNEKPDIVILDVMMPDMDGWEVCRKIKKDHPNLPVSMCSILRDSHEIDRSLEYAGADRHITKPLSFDEVVETISAMQLSVGLAT